VLAIGQIMHTDDLPVDMTTPHLAPGDLVLRGGSSIIAPDGSYVVEPKPDEETIITADLDLGLIDRMSMTLDVAGHYARPDVFGFSVNRSRRS
jgi:predicted amidohydrolase